MKKLIENRAFRHVLNIVLSIILAFVCVFFSQNNMMGRISDRAAASLFFSGGAFLLNIVMYCLFDSKNFFSKTLFGEILKNVFFWIITIAEWLAVALLGIFAFDRGTDNPWILGLHGMFCIGTVATPLFFIFYKDAISMDEEELSLRFVFPFVQIICYIVAYFIGVAINAIGAKVDFLLSYGVIIFSAVLLIGGISFMRVKHITPFEEKFSVEHKENATSVSKSNSNSGQSIQSRPVNRPTADTRDKGGRDKLQSRVKDICYRKCNRGTGVDGYYSGLEVKIECYPRFFSNCITLVFNFLFIIENRKFEDEFALRSYQTSIENSIKRYLENDASELCNNAQEEVMREIESLRKSYQGLDEEWSVNVNSGVSQEVR